MDSALDSVFFGGGTPSLLSAGQLERIVQQIAARFGIAAAAELSMEMDPGTFDLATLRGYRAVGINRVSMGVQAFQAELLTACGRTHTPDDIARSVDLIRQVDLPNFSLDLISGLPHQTLDHWQNSLEQAIALGPTHISTYDLTVEPVTAFGRWYQPGAHPLPTDDDTAAMYRLAQQTLTAAGFDHYEISNYARPGYQCRHNRVYWENRPFYGWGMGATSYYTQRQRVNRPRTRRQYAEWVQDLQRRAGILEEPCTEPSDALLETLMLGLRLHEGLNLRSLRDQFGDRSIHQVLVCLSRFHRQGWVEQTDGELRSQPFTNDLALIPAETRLRFTDPEGFLFSNVMLSDLFKALDRPAPEPSGS
ncbi:MAG TPA: radical SAM family heme chaperone HemW [Chroococcidiopsis sp.]